MFDCVYSIFIDFFEAKWFFFIGALLIIVFCIGYVCGRMEDYEKGEVGRICIENFKRSKKIERIGLVMGPISIFLFLFSCVLNSFFFFMLSMCGMLITGILFIALVWKNMDLTVEK